MSDACFIRRMSIVDADRVVELEAKIFSTPWSKESIFYFLKEDRCGEAYVCVVDQLVIGYAFIWIVAGELHIINIAIDKEYRGRNYSVCLMDTIMEQAKKSGVTMAFLEVRQSNIAAIGLYLKYGFKKTGVREITE